MPENVQPEPEKPLSHPEEMIAGVHFQARPVLLCGHARATPAGLVGIALAVLSVAALVWASRRMATK